MDCTSNFEAEQAEMMRKSGISLDPSMWIVKLLMGPIDTSYDTKGEFFPSLVGDGRSSVGNCSTLRVGYPRVLINFTLPNDLCPSGARLRRLI